MTGSSVEVAADIPRAKVSAEVRNTGYRGSCFKNGEIHVNVYGMPDRAAQRMPGKGT